MRHVACANYHFGSTSATCLAPLAPRSFCARLRETNDPLALIFCKKRDEWGKKEMALNSQIQDLQGELARTSVTLDTQFSQIRSQEEELRKHRGEITSQSRDMSKSTSQALASTNRLKRLESELQQREFDVKELKSRAMVDKSDTHRRETDLRTLLKSRDSENFEINSKLNELQRALIAREEEIRRLTSKL